MSEKKPVCSCGKEANCVISGIGWLCKDCFDRIMKKDSPPRVL